MANYFIISFNCNCYGIYVIWCSYCLKKTLFQTILLFVAMGISKALGGILSDKYSIKKIATILTLLGDC